MTGHTPAGIGLYSDTGKSFSWSPPFLYVYIIAWIRCLSNNIPYILKICSADEAGEGSA
jgi:hypothetical protein